MAINETYASIITAQGRWVILCLDDLGEVLSI